MKPRRTTTPFVSPDQTILSTPLRLVSEEGAPLQLPQGVEGEIVIRSLASGTVALEGWVGSLEGHRHALDGARQLIGSRTVEDRVAIILGRREKL
jgi:hypothetical protein